MRSSFAALAALVALAPLQAHANDTLVGTRAEALDREHSIELRIHHGHASLVVRRTFENTGVKHDQATLDIFEMPDGAVATGLRTLGAMWFDGELLDAEVAAARYKYFTGIGGYYPKDPALLSWRDSRHLKLQVFPIEPKSKKTIEYTLEAPTRYEEGRYVIDLPAMGTAALAPTVTARIDPSDALFIDGIAAEKLPTRRLLGPITFSIAPREPPKLEGRFASVGFAKGRALLHTSLAVAPKLSQLPKNAYVVVLVDASTSVADADRAAELAATRAYLSHLPDAHVAVVPFDRAVRPLHTAFVTQQKALDDLKTAKTIARNGSALDVALTDALQRLEQAPAGAPRRVLLLTDLHTRSSVTPAKLKALETKKAILHVATVRTGSTSLSRDDGGAWADVARSTGGVLWNAYASTDHASNQRIFEEWARPLRLDRLSLVGVGVNGAIPLPESLREGEGFDDLRLHSFPTPAVEIKGELWSTKTTTLLSTSPTEERLWSALVFGNDVHVGLTDPETFALAVRGHAVSPMTSFLAIEPGVRPSTAGLEESSGMGFGSGHLGLGRRSKAVFMKIGTAYDFKKFWRDKLAPIAKKCGEAAVQGKIETTFREIVAIEGLSVCATEAAWDLELPTEFNASWQKWDVAS